VKQSERLHSGLHSLEYLVSKGFDVLHKNRMYMVGNWENLSINSPHSKPLRLLCARAISEMKCFYRYLILRCHAYGKR
jgi:hypothetical protein